MEPKEGEKSEILNRKDGRSFTQAILQGRFLQAKSLHPPRRAIMDFYFHIDAKIIMMILITIAHLLQM